MIEPLTLAQLRTPLKAELHGESGAQLKFNRVNSDSRKIAAGDLFVALQGDRFDGHDFLQQVCDAGACGVVVATAEPSLSCPQLVVADTTCALGDIASLNRQLYRGPLIALTGSCGKTTTKEMLARVLSGSGRVHVTRGNLNNHIGVPQTLLEMGAATDFAIIEMGASGPGEIDYLAALAQPTVALVTNVMAAHLQGFGSEAGVAREKSNIYRHLRRNGVAVINADEPYAAGWISELRQQRADIRLLSFSLQDSGADVYASDIRLGGNGCYQFQLNAAAGSVLVRLPVMGRQNVANALAVSACCLAVGLSLDAIGAGLQAVEPVKGRMYPLPLASGTLLVDDSYNANPGSVLAAAALLQDFQQAGRDSMLLLGDLAELGEPERLALVELGARIQASGLPQLLTLGSNSAFVSEGFNDGAGRAQTAIHFSAPDALIDYVKPRLTSNTVVLVKGSRSARMENIVQAITSSGEQQ